MDWVEAALVAAVRGMGITATAKPVAVALREVASSVPAVDGVRRYSSSG